jgi:hypothetical protein
MGMFLFKLLFSLPELYLPERLELAGSLKSGDELR